MIAERSASSATPPMRQAHSPRGAAAGLRRARTTRASPSVGERGRAVARRPRGGSSNCGWSTCRWRRARPERGRAKRAGRRCGAHAVRRADGRRPSLVRALRDDPTRRAGGRLLRRSFRRRAARSDSSEDGASTCASGRARTAATSRCVSYGDGASAAGGCRRVHATLPAPSAEPDAAPLRRFGWDGARSTMMEHETFFYQLYLNREAGGLVVPTPTRDGRCARLCRGRRRRRVGLPRPLLAAVPRHRSASTARRRPVCIAWCRCSR